MIEKRLRQFRRPHCYDDRLNLPNIYPFAIPNAWPKQASSLPSEVSATVTIMLSPKRSTVFTGPRSSIGEDHGATSKRWSSPYSNGWIGLLEPIGNIPPAETEERCYAMLDAPAVAA